MYNDYIMINEFMAKKIGEVLAFTKISNDTIEKAGIPLSNVLGEEKIIEFIEKNKRYIKEINHISETFNVSDIVTKKSASTEEKLKSMRDMYIREQWSNPVEVLEWSGFFEGAAIVHFALVKGCAEGINNDSLIAFSQECIDYHREILDIIESELCSVGSNRSII